MPKVSYSVHQIPVTDVSYSGWPLVTLIFKYLTPATVTGPQSLYETQIFYTSHGYGLSVTVRDFSHCTGLRTLYPWLVTGVFFHILYVHILLKVNYLMYASSYTNHLYLTKIFFSFSLYLYSPFSLRQSVCLLFCLYLLFLRLSIYKYI